MSSPRDQRPADGNERARSESSVRPRTLWRKFLHGATELAYVELVPRAVRKPAEAAPENPTPLSMARIYWKLGAGPLILDTLTEYVSRGSAHLPSALLAYLAADGALMGYKCVRMALREDHHATLYEQPATIGIELGYVAWRTLTGRHP